jgi:hypothetical protein
MIKLETKKQSKKKGKKRLMHASLVVHRAWKKKGKKDPNT